MEERQDAVNFYINIVILNKNAALIGFAPILILVKSKLLLD